MSLTCGLITVEATPGKEPGKAQSTGADSTGPPPGGSPARTCTNGWARVGGGAVSRTAKKETDQNVLTFLINFTILKCNVLFKGML